MAVTPSNPRGVPVPGRNGVPTPGQQGVLRPWIVLRAAGLGDVLTIVPALRALRRAYPRDPILLAGPQGPGRLLQEAGVITGVIPMNGLEGPPPGIGWARHRALNLHGRGPRSHRLLLAGRPEWLVAYASSEAGVNGPPWRDDEHEVTRWVRLTREAGAFGRPEDLRLPAPRGASKVPVPRGAVLVHPGAGTGARLWPTARWAEVVSWLAERQRPVLLTGGVEDRRRTAAVVDAVPRPLRHWLVNLAGATELDDLTRLVAAADVVLSSDTGVAHLATAYGTPSVTLFGPVPPSRWGALADPTLHRALWTGPGEGDPTATEPDPRLLRIHPEEVVAAAQQLLVARVRRASRRSLVGER